jgi:hypothetical protein
MPKIYIKKKHKNRTFDTNEKLMWKFLYGSVLKQKEKKILTASTKHTKDVKCWAKTLRLLSHIYIINFQCQNFHREMNIFFLHFLFYLLPLLSLYDNIVFHFHYDVRIEIHLFCWKRHNIHNNIVTFCFFLLFFSISTFFFWSLGVFLFNAVFFRQFNPI